MPKLSKQAEALYASTIRSHYARGLSQQKVAEAVGLSRSTVRRIERAYRIGETDAVGTASAEGDGACLQEILAWWRKREAGAAAGRDYVRKTVHIDRSVLARFEAEALRIGLSQAELITRIVDKSVP